MKNKLYSLSFPINQKQITMRKIITVIGMTAFLLVSTSCGLYDLTGKRSDLMEGLHPGMTQSEVVAQLGKPEFKRFNLDMEQWEYRKTHYTGEQETVILLDFQQGKLVAMDSYDNNQPAVSPYPPVAVYPPVPGQTAPVPLPEHHEREWFDQLLQALRKEPFQDKQMELLYDAANCHRFSADEIIKLIKLYPFDDDRMKVLEIMAPALYDKRNDDRIVKAFTFDDNRQKAREVLQRSRQPHRPLSDADLENLYHKIKDAFPTEEKISTLHQEVSKKYITCRQCVRLLSLCDFDNERITFLKVLAPHVSDPQNSRLILDCMSFPSGKEEAQELLDCYGYKKGRPHR